MDYSQFLAMKQEIALLVVFLLVSSMISFMPARAARSFRLHYRAFRHLHSRWILSFRLTEAMQSASAECM